MSKEAKNDNPVLRVNNATDQGYIEVGIGGAVNFALPESKTRRGRVIDNGTVTPTLDSKCEVGIVEQIGNIVEEKGFKNPQRGRVYSANGVSPTLNSMSGGGLEPKIVEQARPCLTPDQIDKRQNGRRFKEDGEESFSLTTQDRHGVAIGQGENIRIRKLTPKECFRLQGFPDELFERANSINSDSQLYKQAGNSVTVNVIYDIARRM